MSTIGLIVILTLRINNLRYGNFWSTKIRYHQMIMTLQTKKAWDQLKGGFFVGACGSAGFAFVCLSSVPSRL